MPSLIRVVLSEVPVASAGAGGGVFSTTQQLALAVGVAASGACSSHSRRPDTWGRYATVLVIAIQSVIAVGMVAGSRFLPRSD